MVHHDSFGKPTRDDPRRRLRQPRSLFHRGLLAAVAFIGPVFGVLYVIVLPDGPWLAVVLTQVLATLLAIAASVAFFRSGIWISPSAAIVTERGFFGRLSHFDKSEAVSILLARVYTSDGSETRPQLVILGSDKKRLLRMRGQYWTQADMDVVASHFEVPVLNIPDAVSTGELRADYPHALYVMERDPVIVAVIAVGATAATAAILTGVLALIRSITA